MAFAGKAAMRSAEAMREAGVDFVECSTIHRALHLQSQATHPESLNEDVIVLDEASMIPNWLMAKVVQALRPTATLLLVGDPNQLPPIGHGTPFQDYLALGLPHLHLVQNYRQAGQVSIHQFAEAIREQNPGLWPGAEQGVQTAFSVDPGDVEGDFNTSVKAAAARHALLEWQVVTWKNETRHQLNQHLQELLNPTAGHPLFTYRLWGVKDEYGRDLDAAVYIGDKVLVTDNDYDYNVFNGQTGIIVAADGRTLTVDFADGEPPRVIDLTDARDLMQLGYAVTVHKAQGSGWETVILYQPEPVTFSPRRFYYTSVTRAKNHVELWTTLSQRAWWTNVLQADNDPDSTLIQRVHEAR
jgi:exodeoxyribonuclease V alpha subunit